jgi:hypothetical protein
VGEVGCECRVRFGLANAIDINAQVRLHGLSFVRKLTWTIYDEVVILICSECVIQPIQIVKQISGQANRTPRSANCTLSLQ